MSLRGSASKIKIDSRTGKSPSHHIITIGWTKWFSRNPAKSIYLILDIYLLNIFLVQTCLAGERFLFLAICLYSSVSGQSAVCPIFLFSPLRGVSKERVFEVKTSKLQTNKPSSLTWVNRDGSTIVMERYTYMYIYLRIHMPYGSYALNLVYDFWDHLSWQPTVLVLY